MISKGKNVPIQLNQCLTTQSGGIWELLLPLDTDTDLRYSEAVYPSLLPLPGGEGKEAVPPHKLDGPLLLGRTSAMRTGGRHDGCATFHRPCL